MRLLYKPFGIAAWIGATVIARQAFIKVWGAIDEVEPPKATTRDATWPKVIGAAAIQGAIVSGTRAAVGRAGARSFAHLTGAWPGEREPDEA